MSNKPDKPERQQKWENGTIPQQLNAWVSNKEEDTEEEEETGEEEDEDETGEEIICFELFFY